MIATDKRRTATDAGYAQDGAVELLREFDHGGGLVERFSGKKRRGQSAESILGGDKDVARVLAAAGDIEQTEDDAVWTYAQKLVEVSGHAVPVIDGGNLGLAEGGDIGVEWVGERGRRPRLRAEKAAG